MTWRNHPQESENKIFLFGESDICIPVAEPLTENMVAQAGGYVIMDCGSSGGRLQYVIMDCDVLLLYKRQVKT